MKAGQGLGSICSFLIVLSCLMAGCGGGNSTPRNSVGPMAIVTGSSLAAATGYWTAANCRVEVELTADGGFEYSVTDMSGTTSVGFSTWTASGSSGAVINGGTFFWVSGLANISGSTSSGSFTSSVQVTDETGTSQSLGPCSFKLQSGQICPVSGGAPQCG